MTASLNNWHKLGVCISTLVAVLFISGCQKSDVEKCVDARMEAFDELTRDYPVEQSDKKAASRKLWRSARYIECLEAAAPQNAG